MTTQIRWIASTVASETYAAAQVLLGRQLVDDALSQAIEPAVRELTAQIDTRGTPPGEMLDHLTALAAGITSPIELARVALTKSRGRLDDYSPATALATALAALDAAFRSIHADPVAEIELRSGPLREQWEARGLGLMAGMARRVGADLLPPSADVVLVQPVLGGGGIAHLPYNSVTLEAVLANPWPELPEVVRLGWLLAQLQCDLPMHQGQLHRDRLRTVAAWAMIPPVIAAAAEVELCREGESTIARALDAWRVPPIDAGTLCAWWETYLTSRPPWHIALAGLAELADGQGREADSA